MSPADKTAAELEAMPLVALITHCSTYADGDARIHELCNRLTQTEMKLKAACTQLQKLKETLECDFS